MDGRLRSLNIHRYSKPTLQAWRPSRILTFRPITRLINIIKIRVFGLTVIPSSFNCCPIFKSSAWRACGLPAPANSLLRFSIFSGVSNGTSPCCSAWSLLSSILASNCTRRNPASYSPKEIRHQDVEPLACEYVATLRDRIYSDCCTC